MGERAMLWPMAPLERPSLREQTRQLFRKPNFNRLPGGNTPIARVDDLDDDMIVIYPEIILGNPLDATNVARWLLYKPGLLHPFEFGPDEMFFKASDFSDDVSLTGGAQLLYMTSINSCYRDYDKPNRQGSCYMIRKGKGISLIHNLEGSHNIDGLTHEETAKAFNECEFFYCYDEATMYSQYAAICGCTSIVIPVHYQCREDWVRDRPIARYGVAYGMEDIEHARATRHQLLDYLVERKRSSLETVATFVIATKKHFNFSDS
jgi:hypothetical protein